MAETTTPVNACDVSVWLDNESGVLKDISGSTNQINMEFQSNIGELRVLSTRWPLRLQCGKDATFSLIVVYSTAADEGMDIIKNWFFGTATAARSLVVYIPDKNVGSDKFYGEVVLESCSWPVNAGDAVPIPVTASLRPSGSWALAVNAT